MSAPYDPAQAVVQLGFLADKLKALALRIPGADLAALQIVTEQMRDSFGAEIAKAASVDQRRRRLTNAAR